MKTIIRLESKYRYGIYSTPTVDDGLTPKQCDEITNIISDCTNIMMDVFGELAGPKHPSPYDDSKLSSHSFVKYDTLQPYFFGFIDNIQFRTWFYNDEVLRKFGELGVTIVCYQVKDRIDGNTQSVALKSEKTEGNELWRVTPEEYLNKGFPETIFKNN